MEDTPLICPTCGLPADYAESDPEIPILRRDSMMVLTRFICRNCLVAQEVLHEVPYSAETVLH